MLARDLKALGLYQARALSYDGVGVEVEILEHPLTPEQRRIYDAYAGAFKVIHHNINEALNVNRLSILTPDRRAKLTPLSGTAEVVPVANRGDPRGFVQRPALRGAKPRGGCLLTHRGNR